MFSNNVIGMNAIQREFLIDGPSRQNEMLALADMQLNAQRSLLTRMNDSVSKGSQIIKNELSYQTTQLQESLNEVKHQIQLSTDTITNSIEKMGDRLCAQLDEINWSLQQQNEILSDILHTLKNSRKNEANQLVSQGIRHLQFNEYLEAEDRFLKALEYDSTDFQVLMNLGYIEKNKQNHQEALLYFNKALRLPMNLDIASKLNSLLAISNLYYEKQDYKSAFEVGVTILELQNQLNGYSALRKLANTYTVGVYGVLTEQVQKGTELIYDTTLRSPIFFTKAAVDPDLNDRLDIQQMLSSIAENALNTCNIKIKKTRELIASLEKRIATANKTNTNLRYNLFLFDKDAPSDSAKETLILANQIESRISQKLVSPSYSDCLLIINCLYELNKKLEQAVLLSSYAIHSSLVGKVNSEVWKIRKTISDNFGKVLEEKVVILLEDWKNQEPKQISKQVLDLIDSSKEECETYQFNVIKYELENDKEANKQFEPTLSGVLGCFGFLGVLLGGPLFTVYYGWGYASLGVLAILIIVFALFSLEESLLSSSKKRHIKNLANQKVAKVRQEVPYLLDKFKNQVIRHNKFIRDLEQVELSEDILYKTLDSNSFELMLDRDSQIVIDRKKWEDEVRSL